MRDLRQIPTSIRHQVSGDRGGSSSPAYAALVAIFGGDELLADQWLDDWLNYVSTSSELVALFALIDSQGSPSAVLARTIAVPLDLQGAAFAPGFDWQSVTVLAAITTITVPTDIT